MTITLGRRAAADASGGYVVIAAVVLDICACAEMSEFCLVRAMVCSLNTPR